MAKLQYPLKQVLEVKQRRVEEAERLVKEKIEALEKEKEKLAQREAERDKVLHHYQDKLKQLRDELDGGTTSPKIQQMKAYIKVVQERLVQEEKKVKDQKEQVEIAKKNLEQARQDLNRKRVEVDKIETHRKDWEKTTLKELEVLEAKEQDEMGNITYSMNQKIREKFGV